MKSKYTIKKPLSYVIKLPNGKIITPGPGTVPTSEDSVQETDINKMIQAAREVSKAGIFDTENEYGTTVNLATK